MFLKQGLHTVNSPSFLYVLENGTNVRKISCVVDNLSSVDFGARSGGTCLDESESSRES